MDTSESVLPFIMRESEPLFDSTLQVTELRKGLVVDKKAASVQGSNLGRQQHPILMQNAIQLMLAVNIQQTCIQTKRDATVGLGFETQQDLEQKKKKAELDQHMHDTAIGAKQLPSKPPAQVAKVDPPASSDPKQMNESQVDIALDPLCEQGFQSLLNQVGEDYENTGNGYFEVVRDGTTIVSLWHIPSPSVFVVMEEERPNFHYEVDGVNSSPMKFARFNDLEGMKARTKTAQQRVTEIVHFKQISSLSPYYGIPSWLACVSWLELAQMVMQYNFDYFQNRAVPDLMVLLMGKQLPTKDLQAFKDSIKGTIGSGNRFRSLIANFADPEMKVQVERLNADNRETFADLWSTVQLQIVSSHRVPPLLAGVTLPGKMAAANELPNALIAFQTLYVDQHQKIFKLVLGKTLGSEEAGLGLKPENFTFKKITDYYDMGQVDTMSRMRDTAASAQMEGRKLQDGLKK